MILFKFCYGPIQTNAILFGCPRTKKGAIVDSPLESTEAILAKAKEIDLRIEKILLTHSHWDHIADLSVLKEKTGAPVYVHELDAGNVERPGSDGLGHSSIQGVAPSHFLTEGQVIEVGDLRIEVIHTPGHSPGCVCFYFRKEGVLISGDTLFSGCMGRVDLPTSHSSSMWDSLHKLAKLPPETRVIPGHGKDTTIGQEDWLYRE